MQAEKIFHSLINPGNALGTLFPASWSGLSGVNDTFPPPVADNVRLRAIKRILIVSGLYPRIGLVTNVAGCVSTKGLSRRTNILQRPSLFD
jgi:hypothetical protein